MRTPSRNAAGFGGHRPAWTTLNKSLFLAIGLASAIPASADDAPWADAGFDEAITGVDSLKRRTGIVTVPSWVGLTGGADVSRRGALVEGYGIDGQISVTSGRTEGLAAPMPGNLAPPINPESRRSASVRSESQVTADADLRITAGMTDSRETVLVAPDAGPPGELQRTAAGFGSALGLFDDRLRLGGEFAGTRLRDGAADPSGESEITGIAERVSGEATLIESGWTSFGVSGFHQSAHAGYAVAGAAAPDWTHDGAGARFALGPIVIGFQADRRHNNLDHDPTVLTVTEQAFRPSIALSLERLRGVGGNKETGAFSFGRLIPSNVRLDATSLFVAGTPEPGSALGTDAVTRQRIRRSAIAFDWTWDHATTTLALAGDTTDSVQPGKEALDGLGRDLRISHAIRAGDLAATLAVGLRRAESLEPGNRSETESVDLSAALAGRNLVIGDLVTSFAVYQARRDAFEAGYTDVDTTWQAKAALDFAQLPSVTDDGRLTMAVSFNGNDPDLDNDVRRLDIVFGLAAQMRF